MLVKVIAHYNYVVVCEVLQTAKTEKNQTMSKSSIHVLPVKAGSEKHNQREKELSYVRSDLSRLNSSFVVKSIAEAKAFAEKNCKEKTGRAMQAKATPIREGVLLIDKHHTADDLKKLAEKIEQRFDIKTIQGYCHKDEGHYDKETKEWKPNYHAHMVFDWTDHATGKSIKMSRDDMAELQTIVANSLELERGVSSSKVHLNAIQYKSQQEQKDLEKIHNLNNGLFEAKAVIEKAQTIQKEIEPLKKTQQHLSSEVEALQEKKKQYSDLAEQEKQRAIEQRQQAEAEAQKIKEIQKQQKQIIDETDLHRANLKYIEEKGKEQSVQIRENEKIIQQQEQKIQKSKGLSR